MQIKDMIEFWEKATDEQRNDLANRMSYMNTQNRNKDKTTKFAEKIIKKNNDKKEVFKKFIESTSINGVIYAPTQVGKSAATREFIETCFLYNTPVIVSTDNKTDQQEQLYYRIKRDLICTDVFLLKVSDKSFSENLKQCIEKKQKFIIFCLDNSSQIEKLIVHFVSCYTRFDNNMSEYKNIAIIHDEADIITKDKNVETIDVDQALSHKKWIEFTNIINKNLTLINLKRVFVTATPENCVMLYNIDCPDLPKVSEMSVFVS